MNFPRHCLHLVDICGKSDNKARFYRLCENQANQRPKIIVSKNLQFYFIQKFHKFLSSGLKMPKYYCDYCDTHLTHDSPSVRKTHCSGRKHKENVKFYYQKWMEDQVQLLQVFLISIYNKVALA